MLSGLGSVLRHPGTRVHHPDLYRSDRVHLSNADLDLFLHDLQGSLGAEVFGCVGGLGAYK